VRALLFTFAVAVAAQPVEQSDFLPPDLVELVKLDPTIRLDIRYATTNNFAGRQVYTQARAFLQRPAAEALVRVHRQLEAQGLGLLIFDAYRPWSVTKIFWDITPPEKRNFVANPRSGSKHNRGCAVDLTLLDRRTGKPLPMPSEYDEFSERAYGDYSGGTEQERRNRELLRAAMEAEGFAVVPHEWWHFDYKDWRRYRIENVPFESLP
jgi:D-alanyl-D-alanine dipeptidase